MACYNCDRGHYCTYHEGSTKLSTGISYTKKYNIYDLESRQLTEVELRPKDRTKRRIIEIEEKTATCTKCRRMDDCKNYFVLTRSGSANVCICQFCIATQYANNTELFTYVKKKLLSRYRGRDEELRKLLRY